jgi:predicted RNase H-like nuclease (RuvC/YqgF family)
MDVSSVTAASTVTTGQTVNKVGTQSATSDDNETSVTVMAGGDTVEISDEGRSLSVQASEESATAENETADSETEETSEASESGGGSAAGSTSESSSDTEDEIKELQDEIAALQQEIASLAAKAATDESAKSEMQGKQATVSTVACFSLRRNGAERLFSTYCQTLGICCNIVTLNRST